MKQKAKDTKGQSNVENKLKTPWQKMKKRPKDKQKYIQNNIEN